MLALLCLRTRATPLGGWGAGDFLPISPGVWRTGPYINGQVAWGAGAVSTCASLESKRMTEGLRAPTGPNHYFLAPRVPPGCIPEETLQRGGDQKFAPSHMLKTAELQRPEYRSTVDEVARTHLCLPSIPIPLRPKPMFRRKERKVVGRFTNRAYLFNPHTITPSSSCPVTASPSYLC